MPEKHGKSSEVYKELLHDFMNFKQTGWKPFGPNIGGVEHMKSKTMYEKKMASRHAFRSLAKKVAADAVGLLPSSFIEDEGAQEDSDDDDDDDEGENKAARSSSANAASTSRKTSSSKPIDLTCQAAKEDVDGRILGFEVGQMRQHYLLQYPTGNKLGVVCCLDGDVEDRTSNQFKLSNDGKTVTRMRRVPKECSSANILLKGADEDDREGVMAGFGSSDIDVIVLESAIKKRMENCKRDKDGQIWEHRDVIDLPFACMPTMVSKEGKPMKTFKVRKNTNGFRWASFWLVGKHAAKAAGASESRRFGGTRVFSPTADDESLYSYQTVRSNDVPMKHVQVEKKTTKKKTATTKHTMRSKKN